VCEVSCGCVIELLCAGLDAQSRLATCCVPLLSHATPSSLALLDSLATCTDRVSLAATFETQALLVGRYDADEQHSVGLVDCRGERVASDVDVDSRIVACPLRGSMRLVTSAPPAAGDAESAATRANVDTLPSMRSLCTLTRHFGARAALAAVRACGHAARLAHVDAVPSLSNGVRSTIVDDHHGSENGVVGMQHDGALPHATTLPAHALPPLASLLSRVDEIEREVLDVNARVGTQPSSSNADKLAYMAQMAEYDLSNEAESGKRRFYRHFRILNSDVERKLVRWRTDFE
jgi:hypothetical protein